MIPEHTKGSIDRYVEYGYEPGGFVTAVLCNDLFGAINRADNENIVSLRDICLYVYNDIPGNCWGDKTTMRDYIASKQGVDE
jgi:hypothetical protein